MNYKRVLIKISGEVLAGSESGGWDFATIHSIATKIKSAKLKFPNLQIALVVGAGNLARGSQLAPTGMNRTDADYVGMLGTIMNAMVMADTFNSDDLSARALSAISVSQAVDDYTPRRVLNHLSKDRIVVIGGGTGRPYMTTDTAGVLSALEIDADVILKATKVDGVYDSDPEKNPQARKFERLSLDEALEMPEVKIMDKAALGMAAEAGLPIVVFKLAAEDSISRALGSDSGICSIIS